MNNVWLKALKAIAEGYATKGCEDRLIVVENPEYQPDNGSAPNLVIDIDAFAALSAPPFGTVDPGVEELARRLEAMKRDPNTPLRYQILATDLMAKLRQQSRALTTRDAGIRQARRSIQMLRRDWTAHTDDYTNGVNDALAILNESVAEGEKG